MGSELRSILLTETEFTEAAGLYYDQAADSPVASGNIAAVEGPGVPNGNGRVTLRAPLVDGQTQITLEPQDMIDMVVAFCRHRAVPLPRSGRKTILSRDGAVVLEIELDWF